MVGLYIFGHVSALINWALALSSIQDEYHCIYQGWPTYCTLRATFRYLMKLAGIAYPSDLNVFNIQYIILLQGEQTFIFLDRIPALYTELRS